MLCSHTLSGGLFMTSYERVFTGLLVGMNAMLLLGQTWPEGAPPFARTASIVVLSLNLVFLTTHLRRARPPGSPASHSPTKNSPLRHS